MVEAEGGEDAHGEEGQQLDQRLEGDGRHHAFVTLGGIQVAGAEDDGEQRQQQRHIQRGVLQRAERLALVGHADFRVLPEDQETAGDRLQLQGDIGDHPDHRDQRHQAAEQRALAVAGGDKVGDRGDAVGLADADHLAQHQPEQRRHQGRAEVDRQEADAAGRRPANAAVEGP
ncbi:hypothetical protein D9M71_508780 [compost metagenome]